MRARRVAGILGIVAIVLATSACTATSPATETETAKQQASDAAQQAFRDYIDAVNDIDIADPSTFERAFALTTGDMNELDRAQYGRWNADGWTKSGDTRITLLELAGISPELDLVQLRTCLDVSDFTVSDADGTVRVQAGSSAVQPLTATLALEGDDWRVQSIERRTTDPPC